MKKYDNYKDSGIDWIGEIPLDWNFGHFKRLTKRVEVGIAEAAVHAYVENGGVPIVRSTNIKNGEIKGEILRINEEFAIKNKSKSLYENDLITVRTGYPGATAIITKELNGCQCFTMLISTLNNNAHPKYYNYLLNSSIGKAYFELTAWGSAQKNISVPILQYTPVVIPSYNEQVLISNYLDNKTSQIDDLISKKEKFIHLLEEERVAVINQAVTKGLDPTVPIKDSGIEWLGETPEHWELKRIKYIGKIISGYSFKSEDFTQTGIRVMKISNIQTMRVDWSDDSYLPEHFLTEFERFKINKGDLVFALTRPIISTGIKATIVNEQENILLNQRNAVLKSGDKLNVRWMYYMIFNEKFKEHFESLIDGTGQQPNISSNDIANINIPLPNLYEQNEIVAFLDAKMEDVETIILKSKQEIELLKEYKTALISEVVTGKLDVRHEKLN